jgi:hypothetical protein
VTLSSEALEAYELAARQGRSSVEDAPRSHPAPQPTRGIKERRRTDLAGFVGPDAWMVGKYET